jgi:hypothetical protein
VRALAPPPGTMRGRSPATSVRPPGAPAPPGAGTPERGQTPGGLRIGGNACPTGKTGERPRKGERQFRGIYATGATSDRTRRHGSWNRVHSDLKNVVIAVEDSSWKVWGYG